MKSQSPLCIALFSLAALTFSAVPAMADPHAKIRSEFTVTIDLLPPAAAPSTATGEVEIKVRQKDELEQTKFEISTSGLAAGSYSIDATDALGAVVHLGDFTPTADDPATLADESEVELLLPEGTDPLDIESVTVSDATQAVVLEGEASTARLRYHANVPVTAAPVTTTTTEPVTRKHGGPGRVHGHAMVNSTINQDVEKQRHFLFIGFGAPADTLLNVNVDGVVVTTVTSTKQGKVMFKSLPETVVLANLGLLTITDSTGAIVMQAQF